MRSFNLLKTQVYVKVFITIDFYMYKWQYKDMESIKFEWDSSKNEINIEKHGLSFFEAQRAFLDPNRIIAEDLDHSINEKRYYCFGKVDEEIITVRFVFRDKVIRIYGAGYWRKGKKIYEKSQS